MNRTQQNNNLSIKICNLKWYTPVIRLNQELGKTTQSSSCASTYEYNFMSQRHAVNIQQLTNKGHQHGLNCFSYKINMKFEPFSFKHSS